MHRYQMNNYPPALILDLSATGLAVARILSKHNVKVYGCDVHTLSIGRFSKYVKKPFFGYKIELNDQFLNQLIEFSNNFNEKPVLFPSSDIFIEFVSAHYEILRKSYRMQASLNPEICKNFLNKMNFYKLCDQFGVNYPQTVILHGNESIDEIVNKLRFPIILKPHLIHKWKDYLKGKKVVYIKNPKDLETIFNLKKNFLSECVLQEVIPGPETNIYIFKGYFNKHNELLAYFVGRKIRQFPPYFGSFSLAESIENEEVKKLSEDFLKKLKFEGLCGTEFKYDEREGNYKIIEINIRPQLWEDLTRLAKREVCWVAYCDLAELSPGFLPKQLNGVRLVYILRDLYSGFVLFKNRNHNILQWLKSYFKVRGDALFDWRDLKLLLGIPLYFLAQFYLYKIKPFIKRKSK